MKKATFVIDTSVAIKWFLKEPFEKEAIKIRDAFRDKKCDLLAPDLIYSEFANTIWKRVLFNNLDKQLAELIIADFSLIPLKIVPSRNLILEAYNLGIKFRRSVYDSLFLSLSSITRSPLVTADEKLYNALNSSFSGLIWIHKWQI